MWYVADVFYMVVVMTGCLLISGGGNGGIWRGRFSSYEYPCDPRFI